MSDFDLTAESRNERGKGASRRLRRESGMVPSILYGAGKNPEAISIAHKDLFKACENEAFFSHILDMNLEGKTQKVILKDLQRHPSKSLIVHADFMRVEMDQVITVEVPLRFVNEESCVGVKQGGGNISRNMASLEVSCLPGDLPEYIEVDIESVGVGESIHMSELVLPSTLVVPALQQGSDYDQIVVSVNAPKRADEESDQASGLDSSESDDSSSSNDSDSSNDG
jgi:large subunit ribosomal protein L25